MIDASAWPTERLHEAMAALASASGLAGAPVRIGPDTYSDISLDVRIDAAARDAGVDVEPVVVRVADCIDLLRRAAPALLVLPSAGTLRVLLLLPARGRRTRPLGPDHRVRRCPVDAVRDVVCAPLEHAVRGDVETYLPFTPK